MTSLPDTMKLGTRGSPLAMTQANMVRDALIAAHKLGSHAIEIVPIKTSGDKIQDRALAEVGGKALWTKELDRALEDGRIDFAVHSMKDVETIRPSVIVIAAMLERADVRDRLIGADTVASIPNGGRVGTSSPRRSAQILRARPDLEIVLFRGNVATRLEKLEHGEADATLLAAAGLDRLGQRDIGHAVPVAEMLPAPSQGAVGIECLADRTELRAFLGAIGHEDTHLCVAAERLLLERLGADCRSPVAALALREPAGLWLRAELLSNDGVEHVSGEAHFAIGDDAAVRALAESLLDRAGPALRALFTG